MIPPLISFIIPVYNSERFLEESLLSIQDQSLEEELFEVILVNDGSNDNSLLICEEWCTRNNFHLVNQINSGVGRARNAGLLKASGTYVLFLDSDDLLVPNSINRIIKYLDEECDMLLAEMIIVNKDSVPAITDTFPEEILFKGQGLDYLRTYLHPVFCTHCFFRMEFLLQNNLFFSSHRVSEDRLFMFRTLSVNPRLIRVNQPIYFYMIRDGSITHNKDKNKMRLQVYDQLDVFRRISKVLFTMEPGIQDKGITSLQDNMLSFFRRLVLSGIRINDFKVIAKELRLMKLLPIREGGVNTFLINLVSTFPSLLPLSRGLLKIRIRS